MTTDYKLGPALSAHDHPFANYAVEIFQAGSGFKVARVYAVDSDDAVANARVVAAAWDALDALRLILTLHENPTARSTPVPGGLLDRKAAEQVRAVLKKAGKL